MVSEVVIASLYSEKIRLRKLMMMMMKMMMMMMIIMNKSQEMMVFSSFQKLTFCYDNKAKIVMVDFKYDALYR